jgi:hypothetical protein
MTIEETIELVSAEAEDLAVQAAPVDLLMGAVDSECGPAVLADLLAHELVACHRLMQRIAAATHGILHYSVPADGTAEGVDAAAGQSAGDDSGGHRVESADLAAARLAGVASRLMEQVRLGIVALRRLRPDLPEDEEGVWLALRWTEERCSPEELERRVAAARAARAQREDLPTPKAAPLSARAEAVRAAAMAAAQLSEEAEVAGLAVAATAEHRHVEFFARLFVLELAAVHDLTMRLAGCADRAFDRAVEAEQDPAAALQLSAVAARLGDRFRRGVLTLQQLAGGGPGKPRKIAGTVWGGPEPSLVTGHSPANDSPDAPAAAPAATVPAGHGVHRSDSTAAAHSGGNASPAVA